MCAVGLPTLITLHTYKYSVSRYVCMGSGRHLRSNGNYTPGRTLLYLFFLATSSGIPVDATDTLGIFCQMKTSVKSLICTDTSQVCTQVVKRLWSTYHMHCVWQTWLASVYIRMYLPYVHACSCWHTYSSWMCNPGDHCLSIFHLSILCGGAYSINEPCSP